MTHSCRHVPLRWRQPRVLASALLGALLFLSACTTPRPTTSPRPGTLRWRVQITDTQRATPLFVAHGMLYLAGRDHAIYALDTATGAQRWRADLGAALALVSAVADGVVYVMGLDQTSSSSQASYAYAVYALDAATGAQRWHIRTRTSPSIDAAVANGLVYFGAWSAPVFALDTATGAQRWQAQTDNTAYAAPAVANGVLYDISGAGNGSVVALDAATGALRWRTQTGSFCCSGLAVPAVADGVVYVGAADTYVYALDAATGAQRWRAQAGNEVFTTPVVSNGVVYVGSYDHNVYALDAAAGALRWKYQTGDRVVSAPVVSNGVVYVSATETDHNAYALDAATGALRWKYQTGGGMYLAPVVANGVAYVGSGDGFLYALNA